MIVRCVMIVYRSYTELSSVAYPSPFLISKIWLMINCKHECTNSFQDVKIPNGIVVCFI